MKRLAVPAVIALFGVVFIAIGCSQPAAPAPTPATKAAEPTKASAAAQPTTAKADPTKAPAAAQATAPAKLDYPAKGKAIQQILAFGAGSGVDVTARLLQPWLEKEIGTSMPIINKPGGGGQVGITDFVKSAKPDGYTIAWVSLPGHVFAYLDPERKATWGRKDLLLVANYTSDPVVLSVKAGSPYKSLKDVVDAAKANPGKIRLTSAGPMTIAHYAGVQLEKAAGIKLAHMFFEQQGEQRAALLGGHADVEGNSLSETAPAVKNGDLIPLAVCDSSESKFLPGVKTAESQGYKVNVSAVRGLAVMPGTPKEIVDKLAGALKKIVADPEHQKALDQIAQSSRYMDPEAFSAFWASVEVDAQVVVDSLKK